MNRLIAISAVASVLGCAWSNPFPHRISEGANITDYEQKGIDALLQLANLAMHVPESYIVDNHRAADVAK